MNKILVLFAFISFYGCTDNNTNSDTYIEFELEDFFKTQSEGVFQPLSPKSTGITFKNKVERTVENSMYRFVYTITGAGVGVGDFNNDDKPDIFFSGNQVENALYINEGNLQFTDISKSAGIDDASGFTMGVTVVDINNDGWLDIYLSKSSLRKNTFSENLLFINNGDLTFTEKAKEYGLNAKEHSTQANFFDYDNDGDLDMYLVVYPPSFQGTMILKNNERIERNENYSDKFFINNGNETFTEVSKTIGINNHGHGLSSSIIDINNDGWLDIYVANDFFAPDFVYLNNGDGTFSSAAEKTLAKMSRFSMGSTFGDLNHNGLLDLVTADVDYKSIVRRKTMRATDRNEAIESRKKSGYNNQYTRNTVQLNNGNGTFSEVALGIGVFGTEWGWSPLVLDFDNNGYSDVFVSNGFPEPYTIDLINVYKKIRSSCRKNDKEKFNELITLLEHHTDVYPNCFYYNSDSLVFTQHIDEGAAIPTISHGAAYADFDNDGDEDIVVNNFNQVSFIYENQQKKGNNWIRFRLTETNSENKASIGSTITIFHNNRKTTKQVTPVRGYQSSSDISVSFGLGKHIVDSAYVDWYTGKRTILKSPPINQTNQISDDHPNTLLVERGHKTKSKFTLQADSMISFTHIEDDLLDYRIQKLIPKQFTDNGPGVAVGDLNGDGLDDIVFGCSSSGKPTFYVQEKNEKFTESTLPNLPSLEYSIPLTVDLNADGLNDILLLTGGYEEKVSEKKNTSVALINKGGQFSVDTKLFQGLVNSNSCISATDLDNNNIPELFIGSRMIPQKYPKHGKSALMVFEKDRYVDRIEQLIPEFKHGIITSALWTDFNNDGLMDLITVGEWMNIEFYKQNKAGTFDYYTNQTQLPRLNGLWNSAIGADFDNDGDIDYVLGNKGLNTRFKPDEEPLMIHYGLFGDIEDSTCFVSFVQNGIRYPINSVHSLKRQYLPMNEEKKTYHEWASLSIYEMFGNENLKNCFQKEVNILANIYINNNGDGTFSYSSLPLFAQFSPIKGMVTWDMNDDGFIDLLAHGNNLNATADYNSQDAGQGIIMHSNGDGTFSYTPPHISNFYSHEDARALALLKTNKEIKIVGTNNNGSCIEYILPEVSSLRVPEDINKCILYFENNSKRMVEIYTGHGYISESSRVLSIPDNVRYIEMIKKDGSIDKIESW